ncbi:MAG: hypothetical protein RLZZ136_1063 [Pseudomonadota bacterium]
MFWFTLVFSVTMALLPHPPHMPTDRLGDKVNHILAFASLAALAGFAFPWVGRWTRAIWLSGLGAVIEMAQAIPLLHRDCDLRDWLADSLAVLAVTALAAMVVRIGKRATPQ